MTTALLEASTTAPGAFARIWNVVRLHYTNRWTILGVPWMIIGFVFLVNLAIWIIIRSASGGQTSLDGTQWSGSTAYIFIYSIVVAVQAMNQTFSFALGYSATRRDYYLGSVLAFGVQSALFTIAFVLLSYIEEWTGGWGLGGHFFANAYFGTGPIWQRMFTVFGAFLFCFFIGSISGAVFVRWKLNGMLVLMGIVAVLGVGGFAVAALTNAWSAIGAWFVASGATGVVAWLLIPSALAAIIGFFVLRRATPRG